MDEHLLNRSRGIRPLPSGRSGPWDREWRGGEIPAERRPALQRHYRSMGEKPPVSLVSEAQHEAIAGQRQRPEKQRASCPDQSTANL